MMKVRYILLFLILGVIIFFLFSRGEAPPCSITQIVVGSQTECDPLTGNYHQELFIHYENPPAFGNLFVNSVPFDLTSSPQRVVLTFRAKGMPRSVEVHFTGKPECGLFERDLFVDPNPCIIPEKVELVLPSGFKVGVMKPTNGIGIQFPKPGVWRLFADVDLSARQKNESFFVILLEDKTNKSISSLVTNAGKYFIVEDKRKFNSETSVFSGDFRVPSKGNYTVDFFHYFLIADEFPEFQRGHKMGLHESVNFKKLTFEFIIN